MPSCRWAVLWVIAACGPSSAAETSGGTEASTGASGVGTETPPTTTPTSTSAPVTSGPETGNSGEGPSTGPVDPSAATTTGATSTGGTTEASTGSTTGEATTGGTTAETTGGTTGDTTTGGMTGNTTMEEPDGPPETTGGMACAPSDPPALVAWTLELPDGVGPDVTGDCVVLDTVVMDDVAVSFSCVIDGDPETVVLRYRTTPSHVVTWEPDAQMEIRHRVVEGAWTNEWLAVGPGSFSAMRADALAPPGLTTQEFYNDDFGLAAPCDPAPDACGMRQSLALAFEVPEEPTVSVLVADGEWHDLVFFGLTVRVWIEHASRVLTPNLCEGTPPRWIEAIVMRESTGL